MTDFGSLTPAQQRVLAAGCAHRVTPLVEAFGTDTERWAWRDALAAAWAGQPHEPALVYRAWRAQLAGPSFLRQARDVLFDALAGDARDAALDAGDVMRSLAESHGAGPVPAAAEAAAQRRALDAVRRLPEPAAAAAVRAVTLDLEAVIARIARLDLPASPALPPRPPARPRQAPAPRPDAAPRVLVAAVDRTFTPDPDGRPPFRSGDIVRLVFPSEAVAGYVVEAWTWTPRRRPRAPEPRLCALLATRPLGAEPFSRSVPVAARVVIRAAAA